MSAIRSVARQTRLLKLALILLLCLFALSVLLTMLSVNELVKAQREVARLEGLYSLNVMQLQDAPAGGVVIEGHISPRTPTIYHTLVAFVRKEGSPLYEMYWKTLEQKTPPLWLTVPGGVVRIINGDYVLVKPPVSLADGYFGFEAGSRVTVLGTVARDEQEPVVHADLLIGGGFTGYLFERRWAASFPLLMNAVFGMLALFVLAVMRYKS
jgi:hypothetical protein